MEGSLVPQWVSEGTKCAVTHNGVLFTLKRKERGRAWWLMAVIPATPEVETCRVTVGGQPGQKVSKIPS
jgi:hypothetical protein